MLDKSIAQYPVWLDDDSYSLADFKAHVQQVTKPQDYPHAADISKNIPVYDAEALRSSLKDEAAWRACMAEWNKAFATGPGIIAIKSGYTDLTLIDKVSDVLNEIISREKASNAGKGDHFAAAGSNSRLWNAHEKLCMENTELFIAYNTNDMIRRVSEAWLGAGYQITTQANCVHPGGKAQTAHRDYHMGFQTKEALQQYPASQHALSAQLTLQGAIAHCDMSIETGPTKLLPYSQSYLLGYLAVLKPEFREYFEEHYVQLPLAKGDLLFFNPATFHAAGDNKTDDFDRFANLMQVGSAYGRSIEILDRLRMSKAIYPALIAITQEKNLSSREIDNVVAATAEGYPFPANLDLESPLSGMAPPSQQDIMRQALREGWSSEKFNAALDEQAGLKRSH